MAQCNHCTLKYLKEKYENQGLKVTVIDSEPVPDIGPNNPKEVFVSPPGIDIPSLSHNGREEYFVVWFLGLSDHCEC